MEPHKIHKKNGLTHLLFAIKYAFDGLKVLATETAFLHEVLFFIISLVMFALKGANFVHYFNISLLWFLLLAAEAFNTAIELIVDHISPQISDFAKKAKDLGSFAVFCLICINLLFVGCVLTGLI